MERSESIRFELPGAGWAILASNVAVALIAVSVPLSCAQAQTFLPDTFSDAFGTEFGDGYSSILLNQVFGPLFPSAGTSVGATVFSRLIGFVNLAVLAIGGVLFLYNATVGLLQTAHEGEVLGRRWSSLWAPLRVLFAAGLLAPVPNLGGYNAIQGGIAWLVKGSTSVASEIWGHGVQLILSGEIPVIGMHSMHDDGLFKSVYRNQLCARIANFQLEAAGSPLRVTFREARSGGVRTVVSSIDGKRNNICGSYEIPETPRYIERLDAADAKAVEQVFNDLHLDALSMLIGSADQIIVKQWPALIGTAGLPDIGPDIQRAVSSARNHVAEGNRRIMRIVSGYGGESGAARRVLENFITGGDCEGPVDEVGGNGICFGEGWLGAGNWYMTIARLNSEAMGLLNATVSVVESRYISAEANRLNRSIVLAADAPGWVQRLFSSSNANKYLQTQEAIRIWSAANEAMENASIQLALAGFRLSHDVIEEAAISAESGMLGRIWKVSFAPGIETMIENFSPSRWGDDPIIGIVNMGNWYLDVAGTLLFGSVAVSFLSSSIASVVTFLVAAPLAAVGISQSFILPLLPFVYWVLAVVGYFLLVVEAVVASSVWALSHLRLDGEGISGEPGRQGWLMLLALLLTPALMVLGYFAGMALFRIASGLLDYGMYHAMSALVNASPLVGIFGLIATGFLVVMVQVAIIERSFSLVSEFPGRVLGWIGGEARIVGSGEMQRIGVIGSGFATGFGGVTRRLGSAMSGGGLGLRRGAPAATGQ